MNDSKLHTLDSPLLKNNMAILRKLVLMANKRGIQVVLLVTPQNPGFAETGVYGAYGVQRSIAQELLELAGKMNVLVLDENKMGKHDYTSDMAFNMDHLSREGARQLSGRLDSLFRAVRK